MYPQHSKTRGAGRDRGKEITFIYRGLEALPKTYELKVSDEITEGPWVDV